MAVVYLDPALLGANIVLSNANLTATQTSATTGNTRAIAHHSSGKYYYEFTVNVTGNMQVGLCATNLPLTQYLGQDSAYSIGVDDLSGWLGAGGTTTAPTLINGHVYGVAIDLDAKKAWCKDITAAGNWNADASANPATGVNGATFPFVGEIDYLLSMGSGSFALTGSAMELIEEEGAWSPASLPGLVAWYKADAGVYSDAGTTLATDGQNVLQWNDQSGHGYHLSDIGITATKQKFRATGLNGKKAVEFTFSFNTGMKSAAGVVMGTGAPFSCFAIAQVTSGAATHARLACYTTSSSINDYDGGGTVFINRDGANAAIGCYRNGNVAAITMPIAGYSTTTRMGVISSGGSYTPYVNNVAGTPATDIGTFISGGWISVGVGTNGAGGHNNVCWDGPISEIVITNTALNSTDRGLLDDYLAAKWPWTPLALPGLFDYREASSGIYTDAGTTAATNGQSVQQWNSMNGSGVVVTQATSGRRPVYSSTQGGKLNFTLSAASYLASAYGAINLGSTRTTFSMFCVARIRRLTDSYGRIMAYAGPGVADYVGGSLSFSREGTGDIISGDGPGSSTTSFGTQAIVDAAPVVFLATVDGTNLKLYVNGVLVATKTQANNVLDDGTLGFGTYISSSAINASNHFDGELYAAGIVNGVISDSDIALLQTYLESKYPIAGPVLHYLGFESADSPGGSEGATYNDVPIGTAYATRRVILHWGYYDSNFAPLTNIQINGSTTGVETFELRHGDTPTGPVKNFISTKLVPTGTTCTFSWATVGYGQFAVGAVHAWTVNDDNLTVWPPTVTRLPVDNVPAATQTITVPTLARNSSAIIRTGWFGGAGTASITTPNDFGVWNILLQANAEYLGFINAVDAEGVNKQVTITVPTPGTDWNMTAIIQFE